MNVGPTVVRSPRSGAMNHRAILLISSCVVVFGCATTADRAFSMPTRSEFERRCRPVEHVPGSTLFPSLSEAPQLRASEAAQVSAATGFSPLSVEAAHAFGVLPLLQHMPALERDLEEHREGAKAELQEVRGRIVERILLASFQANGVNAEIACEVARAEQLADYLQQQKDDRARLLTVIAVVAGGVAGMIGGGLAIAEHAVAEGAAVTIGGALSMVFGSTALFNNKPMNFAIRAICCGKSRNLLREIWEGPTNPALFPDVIWRFQLTAGRRPEHQLANGHHCAVAA